ncbi:MAG: primosomal protein N' [Chitinophagales bacterium]
MGRGGEAMEGCIAEVALDMPGRELDRPFDYCVPARLAGLLRVGSRVRVPFGPRNVEGWVVGLKAVSEVSGSRLREVADLAGEDRWLTAQQLAVAQWVAGHYLAPLREALALFAPPGAGGESLVAYAPAEDVLPAETQFRAEGTRRLWAFLQQRRGAVSRAEIRRQFGAAGLQALTGLVARGLVVPAEVRRAGTGPRLVRAFKLVEGGQAEAPAARRLTAGQERVLAVLAGHPAGLTLAELAAAGAGESAVRSLVRRGLVGAESRAVRRAPAPEAPVWSVSGPGPALTAEQQAALAVVRREAQRAWSGQGEARPVLVHGVTGSGKTEIYLRAVAEALAVGRGAIVLVPEISLTPQMGERFRSRFGEAVALLHSRLGAGERFDEWRRVHSGEARVALGARSAVFAPVHRLGLLVVDEEHESSYKQEESPRYHAREVALSRARAEGAGVILGSATPAVESYARALSGEFELVSLTGRPLGRPLPEVQIVDMRAELAEGHREMFSRTLRAELEARLSAGEQALLFLNRRGFSRVALCRACGLVVRCPLCRVALTYHAAENRLRCHYCDHSAPLPSSCPSCGSRYIRHFGVGTERVEEEVRRLFPHAPVARLDVDTTRRKGAHGRILSAFARGEYQVLVGTQMIGKGLDLAGVTLVGVIAADTALGLPDFRAAERTFAMLEQVAGRAGRGATPGRVVVQTYNPEHYAVECARRHDSAGFYRQELAFRRSAGYPPFGELLLVTVASPAREAAERAAGEVAAALRGVVGERAALLGPSPAPLAHLRGLERVQVLLKGELGDDVGETLRSVTERVRQRDEQLRLTWDVDPQSML